MAVNAPDYERVCPVCGAAAAPEAAQCAQCGTLLLGVDLTLKAPTAPSVPAPAAAAPPPTGSRCPHADCGQENPPGSVDCLYCGRPLSAAGAVPPAPTFYRLPAALAEKFRIVEVLPAGGAEAEIMVLEGKASGVRVIAKLYRPGLLPKSAVLERVSRAAFRHVVQLIAHGESEGVGYEVMEYCPHGSLRALMRAGPLPRDRLRQIVVELSEAIAALHALDVIHRDIKPENVLVRRREPLDLVLTDFGIASVSDATQLFTSLARSTKYGAPETLAGVLDRAADWWSLGMILVELVTGRHPFDGLSDAVITHRLVTGGVDVDTIAERDWRMLCRGLLLRDPKARWGAAEIRRWLDGDATLPMPLADAPAAPALVARPYRIEDSLCGNAAELAVALATHWEAGRKDLARGQLSAWVGQELKDDNLLRFIHDLLDLRGVSDDLRLLRLIRRLAPDLPPAWRGASLALPGVLARAARAAQGDPAAADWLLSVLAQQALRELPLARHPLEAAFAARWEAAQERFLEHWRTAEAALHDWRKARTSHDGMADYDALVLGQPEALQPPAPARLQPRLALALGDESHAAAQLAEVRAAAAPWLAEMPWLAALLVEDDPVAVLAASFLLPLARAAAADLHKRMERQEAASAAGHAALRSQANQWLTLARAQCALGMFANAAEREAAGQAVGRLLGLLEEARRAGLAEDATLLLTLRRAEPVALRIQERLDAWNHAAQINALWQNRNLLQGSGGGILILFLMSLEFMPLRWLFLLLLVPLGVVAWRLMALAEMGRALRQLAQALPLRVPAAETAR